MTFRRRYSRFRPENPAVTICTDRGIEVGAEVENESYGGLGLTCTDAGNLTEGQMVTILIEDASYEAVIVSIRQGEEDRSLIGVKWLEEDEFSDDEE